MKMKFLKNHQHKIHSFKKGDEVDVHVRLATKLITDKVAVPVVVSTAPATVEKEK